MKLSDKSCAEFAKLLAMKEPVPGGGGAAALTGALGVALNSMVANFSIGKKKLLQYEDKHKEILEKGEILGNKLIELIDKDAENFLPLSKAYGMPKSTEEEKKKKREVLQSALKVACSAPVEMVECIYDSILLHEELVDISSKLIISDVGVGVQCLKAALHSANLNVIININSIEDQEYVEEVKIKCEKLVKEGSEKADIIFDKVMKVLTK